jgi:hypothetical protein
MEAMDKQIALFAEVIRIAERDACREVARLYGEREDASTDAVLTADAIEQLIRLRSSFIT